MAGLKKQLVAPEKKARLEENLQIAKVVDEFRGLFLCRSALKNSNVQCGSQLNKDMAPNDVPNLRCNNTNHSGTATWKVQCMDYITVLALEEKIPITTYHGLSLKTIKDISAKLRDDFITASQNRAADKMEGTHPLENDSGDSDSDDQIDGKMTGNYSTDEEDLIAEIGQENFFDAEPGCLDELKNSQEITSVAQFESAALTYSVESFERLKEYCNSLVMVTSQKDEEIRLLKQENLELKLSLEKASATINHQDNLIVNQVKTFQDTIASMSRLSNSAPLIETNGGKKPTFAEITIRHKPVTAEKRKPSKPKTFTMPSTSDEIKLFASGKLGAEERGLTSIMVKGINGMPIGKLKQFLRELVNIDTSKIINVDFIGNAIAEYTLFKSYAREFRKKLEDYKEIIFEFVNLDPLDPQLVKKNYQDMSCEKVAAKGYIKRLNNRLTRSISIGHRKYIERELERAQDQLDSGEFSGKPSRSAMDLSLEETASHE